MSVDLVDDLHNAEDRIGELRAALVLALGLLPEATRPITPVRQRMAEVVVAMYCRPTCGAEGQAHNVRGSTAWIWSDDCDCPCHEAGR